MSDNHYAGSEKSFFFLVWAAAVTPSPLPYRTRTTPSEKFSSTNSEPTIMLFEHLPCAFFLLKRKTLKNFDWAILVTIDCRSCRLYECNGFKVFLIRDLNSKPHGCLRPIGHRKKRGLFYLLYSSTGLFNK